MKFKSIKGTKDILPDDIYSWQYAESVVKSTMEIFNYREIRTPAFEETSLFARGIGELTDIVGKEMYTFIDRSGNSITLKPEMTAAVMRAYIQNNLGERQPMVKVYYLSPMFRQERPQAGRMRQFHQFGAEAIGHSNPAIDAEIITLSVEIYRNLGIKNCELQINSVGCETCRPPYKVQLQKYLSPLLPKLSEENRNRFEQNPLRILDTKNPEESILTKGAPLMKDNLCTECSNHFNAVQKHLQMLNIDFIVNGRIVRGLDYYTKTAYEIISKDLGSQDALAGGGRYDLLIKELGGKQTPSVGFAAGFERLLMVMERQKIEIGSGPTPQLFFIAADDAGRQWSFRQTMEMRRKGLACETDFLGRSVKAQMREADRQQAEYVIVIGKDEIDGKKFRLKNMRTGQEKEVNPENFIDLFIPGGGKGEKRKTD